ncbi:hypothetical protein [Paraburkholderia monticola]|nr:hypothetical protein [Paraburkholderia monticola]
MRLIRFSNRQYDIDIFTEANAAHGFKRYFQEFAPDSDTAIHAYGLGIRVPAFEPGTPRNVVYVAG